MHFEFIDSSCQIEILNYRRDGSPEAVEEGLGLLPEGEEGVRRGGDPHRQAMPGVEDRGRRLPVQLEEEKDREKRHSIGHHRLIRRDLIV